MIDEIPHDPEHAEILRRSNASQPYQRETPLEGEALTERQRQIKLALEYMIKRDQDIKEFEKRNSK